MEKAEAPLGEWKNFASCVAAQRKKGHSEESAKKICATIEQNMKKGKGFEEVEKEAEVSVKLEDLANNWLCGDCEDKNGQ